MYPQFERLPDPVTIETDPKHLTPSTWNRLSAWLLRLYKFEDGTMTMMQHISTHLYDHKIHEINYYSKFKVDGEYKRLKNPAHWYMVFLGDVGTDVPKAFYDIITNLPERILDHYIDTTDLYI